MNKQEATKKNFDLLVTVIDQSTKYNNHKNDVELDYIQCKNGTTNLFQAVKYNDEKIAQIIKIAGELIAKEVCSKIKTDSSSINGIIKQVISNIDDGLLGIESTIIPLKKAEFSKDVLAKDLKNCNVDQATSHSLNTVVKNIMTILSAENPRVKTVVTSVSDLKQFSGSLAERVAAVKLPSCVSESIAQKAQNQQLLLEYQEKANDHTKTEDERERWLEHANKLKQTIDANEVSLNRVQFETKAQQDNLQNISNAVKKFTDTAKDTIMLKFVRGKFDSEELHSFKSVVQKVPKYFDSSDSIREYFNHADALFQKNFAGEIKEVKSLEEQISSSETITKPFYGLQTSFNNLYLELTKYESALNNGCKNPVIVESLSYDRSGWQSFKNAFYGVSTSIMSEETHYSIFGYPSGEELLRRVAEKISKESNVANIENIDAEMFVHYCHSSDMVVPS